MGIISWLIAALIFTSLGFGLAEVLRQWRKPEEKPNSFRRSEPDLEPREVPERLPLDD